MNEEQKTLEEINKGRTYPLPLHPDTIKLIYWENGKGTPTEHIFNDTTSFGLQFQCMSIAYQEYNKHPEPNKLDYEEFIQQCLDYHPNNGFPPSIIICDICEYGKEYIELQYYPPETTEDDILRNVKEKIKKELKSKDECELYFYCCYLLEFAKKETITSFTKIYGIKTGDEPNES